MELSESILVPKVPEKVSESFLSEVVFRKLFRPKVFDFMFVNVGLLEML